MFGTTAFPTTPPMPQPGLIPVSQLLAEVRQTNALLASILAAIPNGKPKPDELQLIAERVEWLERQVAELKGRP